jgi:hypothetical protein
VVPGRFEELPKVLESVEPDSVVLRLLIELSIVLDRYPEDERDSVAYDELRFGYVNELPSPGVLGP